MCPFVLLLCVFVGYLQFSSANLGRHKDFIPGLLVLGETVKVQNVGYHISFDPPKIDKLYENDVQRVEYNVSRCCASQVDGKLNITAIITVQDQVIAVVSENASMDLEFYPINDGNDTLLAAGSFAVKGKRLGKTTLVIRLTDRNADPSAPGSTAVGPDHNYSVIVLRKRRVVDDVFRYGIIALACVLYIGFGCKIELSTIWQILRRPVSPAIGCACQFILMPLLGFGISRMLSLSNDLSFGMLAMAASPGGGSSNVWVSLLGGHLDLSLTMTTISTFGSLGFMPLWMYALGRLFLDSSRVSVPYMTIFRSLLTIVIPCAVGLLLKRFLPKIAEPIARFTRPFSGIFVLYVLTFGTYVNWYMFIIMGSQPKVIGAAILLPALGYSIAFGLALLLRRAKKDAVAISIETGVQNASIPIIMLQGNFPQPEGDIAAVMPVATSLFTQFPIMFAWLGLLIYRRCHPEPETGEFDDQSAAGEMEKGGMDKCQPMETVASHSAIDINGRLGGYTNEGITHVADGNVANGKVADNNVAHSDVSEKEGALHKNIVENPSPVTKF